MNAEDTRAPADPFGPLKPFEQHRVVNALENYRAGNLAHRLNGVRPIAALLCQTIFALRDRNKKLAEQLMAAPFWRPLTEESRPYLDEPIVLRFPDGGHECAVYDPDFLTSLPEGTKWLRLSDAKDEVNVKEAAKSE